MKGSPAFISPAAQHSVSLRAECLVCSLLRRNLCLLDERHLRAAVQLEKTAISLSRTPRQWCSRSQGCHINPLFSDTVLCFELPIGRLEKSLCNINTPAFFLNGAQDSVCGVFMQSSSTQTLVIHSLPKGGSLKCLQARCGGTPCLEIVGVSLHFQSRKRLTSKFLSICHLLKA